MAATRRRPGLRDPERADDLRARRSHDPLDTARTSFARGDHRPRADRRIGTERHRCAGPGRARPIRRRSRARPLCTTAVRLGAEPPEIARTSIILAARAGPTVVITTRRRDLLDALGPIDVPVFVASSYEVALRDAARVIPTDRDRDRLRQRISARRRVQCCGRAVARRRRVGDRTVRITESRSIRAA